MDTAKSVCEHCGKELYTKYMKRHYNDVHNPNYTRLEHLLSNFLLSKYSVDELCFSLANLHF